MGVRRSEYYATRVPLRLLAEILGHGFDFLLALWHRRLKFIFSVSLGLAFVCVSCTSDSSEDMLITVINKSDPKIVQKLLQQGADANARDTTGRPALIVAIMQGDTAIVETLVAHNADVNVEFEGIRPLMFATVRNNCSSEIVSTLLRAGAHVNDRDAVVGSAPLLEAAAYGNLDCVEVLLRSKARLDIVNNRGEGAAYHAVLGKELRILEKLVNAGARVDSPNDDGVTPLMVAAAMGDKEIVRLLLKKNVDVCATDTRGRSAAALAVEEGHDDIVLLLDSKCS